MSYLQPAGLVKVGQSLISSKAITCTINLSIQLLPQIKCSVGPHPAMVHHSASSISTRFKLQSATGHIFWRSLQEGSDNVMHTWAWAILQARCMHDIIDM